MPSVVLFLFIFLIRGSVGMMRMVKTAYTFTKVATVYSVLIALAVLLLAARSSTMATLSVFMRVSLLL